MARPRQSVSSAWHNEFTHGALFGRTMPHDYNDNLVKTDLKVDDGSVDPGVKTVAAGTSAQPFSPALDGRFEALSILGAGAMACVYKARNRVSGNIVAIKLLKADGYYEVKRFTQEAQLISKLDHPNIVRMFDFGIADGTTHLIMEYVDGLTLTQLLERDGALKPARFADLFMQVCDGLAHAQRKGVVHRDIKPSNILIRNDDGTEVAKIADFGIARSQVEGERQNLTQTGEVIGTPLYMSPEQSMGHPVDALSDIYALGCTMYESFALKPPIVGVNMLETLYLRMNQQPKRFADIGVSVPAGLEQIIMRCLETDPQNRYQSAEELGADLQRWSAGENPVKVKRQGKSIAGRWLATTLMTKLNLFALLAVFVFGAVSLTHLSVRTSSTNESSLAPQTVAKKKPEVLPPGMTLLKFMTTYEKIGDTINNEQIVLSYKPLADGQYEQLIKEPRVIRAKNRWAQWYGNLASALGVTTDLKIPENAFDSLEVSIGDDGLVNVSIINESGSDAASRKFVQSLKEKIEHLQGTQIVKFPEKCKQVSFRIEMNGPLNSFRLMGYSSPLIDAPAE